MNQLINHRIMRLSLAAWLFVLSLPLWAASPTQQETSAGLKEALTKSAEAAVKQLGQENGFLANDKVKIPLPPTLARAESLMRTVGMGKQADELVVSMNRAAEAAVPESRKLLVDAVKRMTLDDAKAILTGGDDAATQYFRKQTEGTLSTKLLPIVKKTTDRVRLAQRYDELAGKAVRFGLLSSDDANIERYVTQKTLDGLYTVIAEQEKAIRHDPLGYGSKLIGKVFGSALN